MLVLTISQMRCVRWTPELFALPVDKLAWLALHLLPSLETSDDDGGADEDDASSSSDDDLSVTCPLLFVTKMGSSFGFESSLVLRGRVSIRHFWWGGVYVYFEGCSEVYMYFLFFLFSYSLLYTGLVTIYWHTFQFIFIYMMMYFFSLSTSTCVVSFLLYTHVSLCMQSLFLFHTWCLDEFLFKCFRKTGCKSLPCHELSFCKVFQEFMLGLDLFCNSISGYEFSDLRLLSWFICYGFVTNCQRGRLLGTYLCNWLIIWQNALYLKLGRSRMSLVLQETGVQVKYWSHASLTKKQMKEVLFFKAWQQFR